MCETITCTPTLQWVKRDDDVGRLNNQMLMVSRVRAECRRTNRAAGQSNASTRDASLSRDRYPPFDPLNRAA
jgi:hypothetical protein